MAKFDPPDYPVTCPLCMVTYGPGGVVKSHSPGSMACVKRQTQNIKGHEVHTIISEYAEITDHEFVPHVKWDNDACDKKVGDPVKLCGLPRRLHRT